MQVEASHIVLCCTHSLCRELQDAEHVKDFCELLPVFASLQELEYVFGLRISACCLWIDGFVTGGCLCLEVCELLRT